MKRTNVLPYLSSLFLLFISPNEATSIPELQEEIIDPPETSITVETTTDRLRLVIDSKPESVDPEYISDWFDKDPRRLERTLEFVIDENTKSSNAAELFRLLDPGGEPTFQPSSVQVRYYTYPLSPNELDAFNAICIEFSKFIQSYLRLDDINVLLTSSPPTPIPVPQHVDSDNFVNPPASIQLVRSIGRNFRSIGSLVDESTGRVYVRQETVEGYIDIGLSVFLWSDGYPNTPNDYSPMSLVQYFMNYFKLDFTLSPPNNDFTQEKSHSFLRDIAFVYVYNELFPAFVAGLVEEMEILQGMEGNLGRPVSPIDWYKVTSKWDEIHTTLVNLAADMVTRAYFASINGIPLKPDEEYQPKFPERKLPSMYGHVVGLVRQAGGGRITRQGMVDLLDDYSDREVSESRLQLHGVFPSN